MKISHRAVGLSDRKRHPIHRSYRTNRSDNRSSGNRGSLGAWHTKGRARRGIEMSIRAHIPALDGLLIRWSRYLMPACAAIHADLQLEFVGRWDRRTTG